MTFNDGVFDRRNGQWTGTLWLLGGQRLRCSPCEARRIARILELPFVEIDRTAPPESWQPHVAEPDPEHTDRLAAMAQADLLAAVHAARTWDMIAGAMGLGRRSALAGAEWAQAGACGHSGPGPAACQAPAESSGEEG